MSKNYILNSSENFEIDITAYEIDDLSESNCIIFLHGFKGFKDWGFVPYLGDYLSDNGFFVITFNFSHNGVGRNSTDFNELESGFASEIYFHSLSPQDRAFKLEDWKTAKNYDDKFDKKY